MKVLTAQTPSAENCFFKQKTAACDTPFLDARNWVTYCPFGRGGVHGLHRTAAIV